MPLALKANDAYISPDSDHLPIVTAAGMLLFQSHYITKIDFHYHYYKRPSSCIVIPAKAGIQR
jgi:hypothetical protein